MGDFVSWLKPKLPLIATIVIIAMFFLVLYLFWYMLQNVELLRADPCSLCMDQITQRIPDMPRELTG